MLPQNEQVTDYRVVHEFDRIGRRTMLLNARKIRVIADCPDAILLAIEDITEREQAEDALRKLNEQLEQRVADQTSEIRLLAEAISHLGEGVLITDDNLEWPGPQIRFVNDAMCRISGYSAEELIGQSPRILQGNETSEATRDHIRGELAANRSCWVELINYRKDGTPYDAELFITPLFDAAGKRTNFVSIHRDISERKQAEQALQEREERLRAILNTAADAIITIDQRGIITDVNPATEQMFGYTQDELVGQNVKILMPPPFSRRTRRLHRPLSGNRRGPHHRHRPRSGWPPQRWFDVSRSGWRSARSITWGCSPASSATSANARDFSATFSRSLKTNSVASARTCTTARNRNSPAWECWRRPCSTISRKRPTSSARASAARHSELAKKIVDGIARTHQQVQTISRGLVPIQLDDEGFMNALRELASRTDELEGVTCAFKCEQPVEVADSLTATHLYRIAQEAVTNALKHGHPEHILIALESENGHPILQIADDGTGFDSTGQYRGHGVENHALPCQPDWSQPNAQPRRNRRHVGNLQGFRGGGSLR